MSSINRIAVIGAGTMGGGIAISAICGGIHVMLIDTSQSSLEHALARVRMYLNRQVEKGKLAERASLEAQERLTSSTTLENAAGADLVIEAVFEDLAVKQSVFAEIEKVVGPLTILATNTSALKVADIGTHMAHPERLCGMHYFSPAEINPIVEVINARQTSTETVAAVLPFLSQCKKEAIECKDRSGFALNRFFCPYTNEAARCLDDGLGTPAQIDEVAKAVFGVSVGPFFVMNTVKPRINLAAVQSLEKLGPFYTPARSLVECGETDDRWVIEQEPLPLGAAEQRMVADRLTGAVFYAVREAVNERVASPGDIDLGAIRAFSFARGPNAMMENIGPAETDRLIDLISREG